MAQKQYKFSLSIHDKHNRQVKKIVDGLLAKGNGALSQSIRDGLRLINDLRRGNTRVLLELFPDIIEKLCPPEPPPTDTDDMERRIAEAVAQRLKGELRQQQHSSNNSDIPDVRDYGVPAMKPSKLQKSIAMPIIEPDPDDGATIVLNRSMDSKANAQNLLAGIFGLD